MKNIYCYILISVGLLYASNASGQAINNTNLESKIDALIPSQVNDNTPGLIVGVIHEGELLFSKGYGKANIAYGISNNPNLVYNTGSVSKQFLGYAFAMLHQEGTLNLDDPVHQYLENWKKFEHEVTLRHLLTHTSGYREAYTMSNLAGRIIGIDRLTRAECLEVIRKQPQLEFIPGSRWTYNSTAWVVLAEVLEKVTGQPADKWVEDHIFKPLAMNATQIESEVGEVIYNVAESYTYNPEHGYINQESNRAIFGAAEIYTNIPDLVKWVANYSSSEIGGQAVTNMFLDPFILNDGTNSEYALGIHNDTYRGLKRYRHTGGHEAFLTQLSYYPDQDVGIITVSNYGRKGWLSTMKIADVMLGEFMTSPEDKKAQKTKIKKKRLEELEGLYLASTLNRTMELTISGDSLMLNGRTTLIPISENTFRMNGQDGQLLFEKASDGKTQLTIKDINNQQFTKVDPWSPNQNDLTNFKGDYRSDELETIYHLTLKNEKLTIEHRWLNDMTLEPVTEDIFKTDQGYFVEFLRNTGNTISGLSVNSGRTLNVVFERRD